MARAIVEGAKKRKRRFSYRAFMPKGGSQTGCERQGNAVRSHRRHVWRKEIKALTFTAPGLR
jgi:hypothetical protein